MFVCVFCECVFIENPMVCPNCVDYKGLMTTADAASEYDWLGYLAQPIRYPGDTPDAVPPLWITLWITLLRICYKSSRFFGVSLRINVCSYLYNEGRKKG